MDPKHSIFLSHIKCLTAWQSYLGYFQRLGHLSFNLLQQVDLFNSGSGKGLVCGSRVWMFVLRSNHMIKTILGHGSVKQINCKWHTDCNYGLLSI